jgi:hypothetical protein
VRGELGAAVTQKIQEIVKDSLRENVKNAMGTSFRGAFESSLVPAFQVGTERLFSQVCILSVSDDRVNTADALWCKLVVMRV